MKIDVFPGPAGQSLLSVQHETPELAEALERAPDWPFLLKLRPSPFRADSFLSAWGHWLSLSELLLQPLSCEILRTLIEHCAAVYRVSQEGTLTCGLHWNPEGIYFPLTALKDGRFGLDVTEPRFVFEEGIDRAEIFFSKIVELYFLNREGPLTEESERWLLARDEPWPRLIEVILEEGAAGAAESSEERVRSRKEFSDESMAHAWKRELNRSDPEAGPTLLHNEERWKPPAELWPHEEEEPPPGENVRADAVVKLQTFPGTPASGKRSPDETSAAAESDGTSEDHRFQLKTRRVPSRPLPPVLPLACLTDQAPGTGQLERGRLFWIEGAVILGSSPEQADFLIRDPRVLPEHCLIRAHQDHYSLQQLGLTGSVKLDGRDIPPGEEIDLPEKCVLDVGTTKLYFFMDSVENFARSA